MNGATSTAVSAGVNKPVSGWYVGMSMSSYIMEGGMSWTLPLKPRNRWI